MLLRWRIRVFASPLSKMATLSRLKQLQAATTTQSVAAVLKIKPSALTYLLYKRSPTQSYVTFEIPKRTGGKRQISAPAPDLKNLQRKVADLMTECVNEIYTSRELQDSVAHGFVPGRSIVTNAHPHVGRRFVFNIDLKDFFSTITFPRLYGYFMKDTGFLLPKKAATILAQIACHDGKLPQGSPCSPIMSNLIGHILDVHLVRLAAASGCHYTRYADDLTFSTNKRSFPLGIAKQSLNSEQEWIVGKQLSGLIKKCAFEVNPLKTRMQHRDSRQVVTGLTVNRKVNVRNDYRRNVRAMVSHVLKTGNFHFNTKVVDAVGTTTDVKTPGTLDQLQGMLGFIDQIDLHNENLIQRHSYNFPKRASEKLSSKETMFLRFLLYRIFWAAEKPTFVCEGKTDNVYLTHAIRSLAASFPELASIAGDGAISLRARLFKYTGTSTGRILGNSSGGAPGLSKLMRHYYTETKKFTAPGLRAPIIVLVDNDTGASAKGNVFGTVASLTDRPKPTGKEPFIHVYKNMYVVATPLIGAATTSSSEDFFLEKDRTHEGKKFDPNCEKDTATTFGKATFAYKVVKPKADEIDFSNFKPLLTAMVSVINFHANAVATGSI